MELSRRGFLLGLGALAAVPLIEEAIPLGRVWSFPQKIRLANISEITSVGKNRLIPPEEIAKEIADFLNKYVIKTVENLAMQIDYSALMGTWSYHRDPCPPTGVSLK